MHAQKHNASLCSHAYKESYMPCKISIEEKMTYIEREARSVACRYAASCARTHTTNRIEVVSSMGMVYREAEREDSAVHGGGQGR